jgi:hypothetical protein
MKQLFCFLFSLWTLTTYGQVQNGKLLTTGTLRVRNFYDGDYSKAFQLGIQNKTGKFVTNTVIVGVKADYTWTNEKTFRFGALQQGGSQWFQRGVYNRNEFAIGVFADKYFALLKKLYLTVGIFVQYSRFSEEEVGKYFDQNGNEVGIDYRKWIEPNNGAQLGLTNSFIYFLNERFGINCMVSSLDISIHPANHRGTEFDLRIPIMNLGIQYHFPK